MFFLPQRTVNVNYIWRLFWFKTYHCVHNEFPHPLGEKETVTTKRLRNKQTYFILPLIIKILEVGFCCIFKIVSLLAFITIADSQKKHEKQK